MSVGNGKEKSTPKTIDPTLLLMGNAVHLMPTSWKRVQEKRKRNNKFFIAAIILLVAILITYGGVLTKTIWMT
jgi:hypothetical protein